MRTLGRSAFLLAGGVVCAFAAPAAAGGGGAFEGYGLSYRTVVMPPTGAGSSQLAGDVLGDGRIIAVTGNSVFVESGVGSGVFDEVAVFDAARMGGTTDPAFVRVSPDGSRVAVGGGFGRPVAVFPTGALGSAGMPTVLGEGVASYFDVAHYDAAWADGGVGGRLALTAGAFGSPAVVTLLDTASSPGAPVNPTIISNIGGASSGIAFDAAGRLFTGNGFDLGEGGSETGWIRAFSPEEWMGGGADFESAGVLIADVLSASSLNFDGEGNLLVGGGDFAAGDAGYLGVLNAAAIAGALGGGGAIDVSDPMSLRRLMPTGDPFGFYGSAFNAVTGEVYATVTEFGSGVNTWYATVPGPSGLGLAAGVLAWAGRRRRTATGLAAALATVGGGSAFGEDFASRVVMYAPAPGQLVNNPAFNDPARALGAPVGGATDVPDHSELVTLGGFGGSITLGFDETVRDDPRNPMGLDAIAFGNAFWVGGNPNRRYAEPATVEISRDVNGNGLADDPWYVIPGSHLAEPSALVFVQTWDADTADPTYPPSNPLWVPAGAEGVWATSGYLLPPDVFGGGPVLVNPNGLGAAEEGVWGYADHTPVLALPPGVGEEAFYTVPDDPFEVGITEGSGGGDGFDIAWAVDPATGLPAGLDGFDFIRLTTAVNTLHPLFGEVSAEIGGVARVRAVARLADVNGDGVVDSNDYFVFLGLYFSGTDGADFDGDGGVDSDDYFAFLAAYFGEG